MKNYQWMDDHQVIMEALMILLSDAYGKWFHEEIMTELEKRIAEPTNDL